METTDIPHPIELKISKDEVAQRFVQFTPGEKISPLWQFRMVVEKSFRVGPQATEPQPGGNMTTLALFNRPEPACDLEILAQHLGVDIDPANWLEFWLRQKQITPVSMKRLGTIAGDIGDVIGKWKVNDEPWIGRFFCMKAGPRMVLLWFRVREADYARVAEDIFVSVASFGFPDNSPGPLAEKVRWVNNAQPVNWKLVVPASWEIATEPATPEVTSFQANLVLKDGEKSVLQGKLSFAIARADQATDHLQALNNTKEALQEAGVKLEAERVLQENVSQPFTESWIALARANIGGQAGELRCRIMRHPSAWIVAAALTVDPLSSPISWMRTMRLLNIVTSTIEITPPA
jgi:hypothetical protein